jgi:hypothetical protein
MTVLGHIQMNTILLDVLNIEVKSSMLMLSRHK